MYKDFKNLRLFFGIDWIFCEDKEFFHAEINEAKKQSRKYMSRTDGTRFWIGLLPEGDELSPTQINIPAASIVARQIPNAIVQADIGEQGWICVISEGQPIAGYDNVVSQEESKKIAFEAAKIYMTAQICSSSIEGSIKTFWDILDDASFDKNDYSDEKFPTPVFTPKRIKYIISFFMGLIICVCSYFYYDWYSKKNEMERNALIKKAQQEQLHQAELKKLKEKEIKLIESFNERIRIAKLDYKNPNNSVFNEMINFWIETIKETPQFIVKGALKTKIACQENVCNVQWVTGGSTMKDRINVNTKGATLSGGTSSVDSVMHSNFIQKEYTYSEFNRTEALRELEYPKDLLLIYDEFKKIPIEIQYKGALENNKVTGIPSLNVPDVEIGKKQHFEITYNGPLVVEKLYKIAQNLEGLPIRWLTFEAEMIRPYEITRLSLKGDFLFLSIKENATKLQ